MTKECELLRVVGYLENHRVLDFLVPAYTRTWPNMSNEVRQHYAEYTFKSMSAEKKPSLADFGLYLLAQASSDPHEQEQDRDVQCCCVRHAGEGNFCPDCDLHGSPNLGPTPAAGVQYVMEVSDKPYWKGERK